MFGRLLEVEMSKKCTPLWREAAKHISKSKWTERTPHVRATFGRWSVVSLGRRKGLCILSKVSKREGFVAFLKTMAGVGHLKRICNDACSVAGAIQETCSSEMLGGEGADFLRGVAFWSIRSVGLLRWFCVKGAALRNFFWQAQYFRQVGGVENFKTHWYEAVSSALNFPFLKEVLPNCFVFDVAIFKNWGSLAELLRFDVANFKTLRKSRRIDSFLTLSSSKVEEVSQNGCVFKLAGRQTDRQQDRQTNG